jgi:hypothetical protein
VLAIVGAQRPAEAARLGAAPRLEPAEVAAVEAALGRFTLAE